MKARLPTHVSPSMYMHGQVPDLCEEFVLEVNGAIIISLISCPVGQLS